MTYRPGKWINYPLRKSKMFDILTTRLMETLHEKDTDMATQKMQMRKLAEIGAFLLRWYKDEKTTDKSVLKFQEVHENILRLLSEDQLEFEYDVGVNPDEKVQVK